MQREIGSNFDLNPNKKLEGISNIDLSSYGLEGTDSVLLSTGRSAISIVLDEIERRNPNIHMIALIPPFTCHTVIDPFINKGYKVVAYSVDKYLRVDIEKFREELIASKASVVLIHRYFGFDTLRGFEQVVNEYQAKGIIFFEDKTQCLYSDQTNLNTDYVVGSFRKWAGLPDGGYAICREGYLNGKPTHYDEELTERKLRASYWKYEYLHDGRGEKQQFLHEYGVAEQILDKQDKYYKISPASESVQTSLDLDDLKERRKRNYAFVYERLKDIFRIITPELSNGDVPLYLAISTQKRMELQTYLRDRKIYAPIVWPKAGYCPSICEVAEAIYDTVLCLPIDQRYDLDDMSRMVSSVEEFMRCKW